MKEFSMAWLIFSTLIRESPKDVYNKEELLNLMGRILKEVNDIITL